MKATTTTSSQRVANQGPREDCLTYSGGSSGLKIVLAGCPFVITARSYSELYVRSGAAAIQGARRAEG